MSVDARFRDLPITSTAGLQCLYDIHTSELVGTLPNTTVLAMDRELGRQSLSHKLSIADDG